MMEYDIVNLQEILNKKNNVREEKFINIIQGASNRKLTITDRKTFVIYEEHEIMIEFDINNKEHVEFLNILDKQAAKVRQMVSKSWLDYIPEKDRDKFCVLYGGKVFFVSKSLAEASAYMSSHTGIDWSLYNP